MTSSVKAVVCFIGKVIPLHRRLEHHHREEWHRRNQSPLMIGDVVLPARIPVRQQIHFLDSTFQICLELFSYQRGKERRTRVSN